ncbi:formyltransferase family protein [Halopiger xanaduensis]|uniref:Methionyl-tRNA formyltransferase-like protein n=1 Tax=Halopiger xanaduensis (strain DSM 18323 / JCM 14033 / SH-6) TaxID=797210 RepID=F8DBE8_HALXS|nr:formyltransferase family protein [Halopiger xanaduensis]AEH37063.1 methionyl-tRNA formyltransferase-like protein [Halopiger xanaduensis SH-6]
MSPPEPETVGLLTEPYLHRWQVRAVRNLLAETDVELSLVVSNARNVDPEIDSWNSRDRIGLEDLAQFLGLVRRERAWTLVLAERNLGRIAGDDATLWHRRALEDVDPLAGAAHVRCTPRVDGAWAEFPDSLVTRIARECDVVIRFGFGLIRGAILEAPSHGVVSFHPADIRRYRGLGPPAIFRDGRSTAGVTLQRLDESIDGGEIVAFGETTIEDCHTLWDVFDRTATLQIDLLAEGIENLRDPAFEPTSVPDKQLGDFYSRDQRRTLRFAGRILTRNLRGRVRRQYRRRRPTDDSDGTRRDADERDGVAESSDPHG